MKQQINGGCQNKGNNMTVLEKKQESVGTAV